MRRKGATISPCRTCASLSRKAIRIARSCPTIRPSRGSAICPNLKNCSPWSRVFSSVEQDAWPVGMGLGPTRLFFPPFLAFSVLDRFHPPARRYAGGASGCPPSGKPERRRPPRLGGPSLERNHHRRVGRRPPAAGDLLRQHSYARSRARRAPDIVARHLRGKRPGPGLGRHTPRLRRLHGAPRPAPS